MERWDDTHGWTLQIKLHDTFALELRSKTVLESGEVSQEAVEEGKEAEAGEVFGVLISLCY